MTVNIDSQKERMGMVDVLYDGDDELYAEWYKCMLCGYDRILQGDNYCAGCGKKIDEFLEPCNEEVELVDNDFLKCKRPMDHKGPHRGVTIDGDEICWTDDEAEDWLNSREYEEATDR